LKTIMRNQTFDFQETPDEGESLILDILARTSPAKPNDLPHRMFMRLGLDFELPPAVRVHPCLNYKLGTDECLGQFPAMVMPLRTGAGRYCGLEVLFMDEVTLIAPVVMPIHMYWAEQVSGAHMEIQPPERGVLGVAVNLGQALAVHHLTGAPMCAVRNANDLRDLQIPTGVKQLLVFADLLCPALGRKASIQTSFSQRRRGRHGSMNLHTEAPCLLMLWQSPGH